MVYPATPEYLADYAREFVAAGASIIGGCCGTHPEHIRALAASLKATGSARPLSARDSRAARRGAPRS
ncbi:MAG TPA: homocysteine S-methyltransferase family protein [Gammaproteobacteria bacterium]